MMIYLDTRVHLDSGNIGIQYNSHSMYERTLPKLNLKYWSLLNLGTGIVNEK